MLTLLFRYFNLCLRFRFGNSASDFALRNMKAEHIRMIDELEEQGCLVVILDRFQTAGLKRDDYGYIRFVMTERAEGAIECIRDTEAAKEIRKIDHN
jgi:hypothetical protein